MRPTKSANQIAGMQLATQDRSSRYKQIGTTISRISEIAATIATPSVEQARWRDPGEIARNVEQAAQGTSEGRDQHCRRSQGSSRDRFCFGESSFVGSIPVRRKSNRLKQEVARFLGTVRAA